MTTVVGYIRVSTDEQAQSGAGMEAQRVAIEAEAKRRGWKLATLYEDAAASGKSMRGRQGLEKALRAVEAGQADALVVAKLDRLSRSLLDFASLMERSRRRGWSLVALDLGVDTTTPSGALMANVLASFAEFERRLIGQRTRDALAVRKRQGVKLGRFKGAPPDVSRRIVEMHRGGASLNAIAAKLTAERIPTAQGAVRWYASSVRVIVLANDPSVAGDPEDALNRATPMRVTLHDQSHA
ncbi:MAG: recombinase family protein [Actinomycetota bacterium]|nr:recombinase family protein [Actinomycetota bacterium]